VPTALGCSQSGFCAAKAPTTTAPGRQWDYALYAYATARDAACWQLNRSEAEGWEFLEGLDRVTA